MRFSELDGARVGVWGAGREVVSFAAQLARRLPAAEIVAAAFDGAPPAGVRQLLQAPRARLLSASEAVAGLAGCEVVVRSPGVSIHRQELRALARAGAAITTPTSLWLAERRGERVIGVTGTKGKSTTAALACHLLRASGAPAWLAGNIGSPALDLLDRDPSDAAVVELSSYQIADLQHGPQVAVVTNLFPEHADWHGSQASYRAEKLRLLALPGVQARVLPARDPSLAQLAGGREDRLFGHPGGWDVLDGGVALRGRPRLGAGELALRGEHNALNLCAALTALEAFAALPPALPEALRGFRALPHRLAEVARAGGALWIDDSISTTPESALAALASFPGCDLVLLAGGQDRGQDYDVLARRLAELGAALVTLPSTGPRLRAAALAAGVDPARARQARDLEVAVCQARALARPGGVVLLSPAAPSYDHYRDFRERGERFAALVRGDADPGGGPAG